MFMERPGQVFWRALQNSRRRRATSCLEVFASLREDRESQDGCFLPVWPKYYFRCWHGRVERGLSSIVVAHADEMHLPCRSPTKRQTQTPNRTETRIKARHLRRGGRQGPRLFYRGLTGEPHGSVVLHGARLCGAARTEAHFQPTRQK